MRQNILLSINITRSIRPMYTGLKFASDVAYHAFTFAAFIHECRCSRNDFFLLAFMCRQWDYVG